MNIESSDDCTDKTFEKILDILSKKVEDSNFFNKKLNIKKSSKYKPEDAKKAAALLSAILFVCDASKNRSFDGGKLERASLKYIIRYKKTFSQVYGGENPLYTPAKNRGAACIRSRSLDGLEDEMENQEIEELERYASASSSEVKSEEIESTSSSGDESDNTNNLSDVSSLSKYLKKFTIDQLVELKKLIIKEINEKKKIEGSKKVKRKKYN